MSEKDEILINGRTLIIDENGFSWENKVLNSRIGKPVDIRYSVLPLEFDRFYIGKRFLIELRDEKKNRLKISFRTFFGFNFKKKSDLYNCLLDKIWDKFFTQVINKYIEYIEEGNQLQIGEYFIDLVGIKHKKSSFTFNYLDTQGIEKYDQFLLTSKSHPKEFLKLDHKYDWNWAIVQVIFQHYKNINSKEEE